jgi:CRISPR/Cas system-associated protein Cas10 (large subunit of type III CRISPR-Cas system)
MQYAFFDGDDVGPTLERLLTSGSLEEAQTFSRNVSAAMKTIEDMCQVCAGVEVLFIGGDDALIAFDPEQVSAYFIEDIREAFRRCSGNTMSCGVANTIRDVISKLHEAKLFGKNGTRGWELLKW